MLLYVAPALFLFQPPECINCTFKREQCIEYCVYWALVWKRQCQLQTDAFLSYKADPQALANIDCIHCSPWNRLAACSSERNRRVACFCPFDWMELQLQKQAFNFDSPTCLKTPVWRNSRWQWREHKMYFLKTWQKGCFVFDVQLHK